MRACRRRSEASSGASTSSRTQIGAGLVRNTAKMSASAVSACSPPDKSVSVCGFLPGVGHPVAAVESRQDFRASSRAAYRTDSPWQIQRASSSVGNITLALPKSAMTITCPANSPSSSGGVH